MVSNTCNLSIKPTKMKKGVGISLVFIVLALGLAELYLMLTLNESIIRHIKTFEQRCNSNVKLAIITLINSNQTENLSPSKPDLSEKLLKSTKSSDSETLTIPELLSFLDTKPIEKSTASNYGETKLLPEVSSFDKQVYTDSETQTTPELFSFLGTKPIEKSTASNYGETKLLPEVSSFDKVYSSEPRIISNSETTLISAEDSGDSAFEMAYKGPLEPYVATPSQNEEIPYLLPGLEMKQKEVQVDDVDKNIERSNLELPPSVFKTEQPPSSEEYSYSTNDDYSDSDGYPDYIY